MASSSSPTNQRPQAAQPGDGETISATRARQATRGRHVLLILVASLAAVVIGFLIAFGTNSTNPVSGEGGNGSRVTDPATASTFDAPQPAPKQPG